MIPALSDWRAGRNNVLSDTNVNNNNNNNHSFNMVKTHAQPYKHIIHVYVYKYNDNLSRRTATSRPTRCHAGQQQHKV